MIGTSDYRPDVDYAYGLGEFGYIDDSGDKETFRVSDGLALVDM